ncbi:Transmembrane osmosensor [Boothiomyces macroporosus]|uniref:Transmembrane osmosensor n=1 Tax=Boothiomyces macroporosus TaxID=261099 RepID=A0AAD5UNE2_9FUNG|nr:Transmembrane osmosensor [Boothiomyces macroporosus]
MDQNNIKTYAILGVTGFGVFFDFVGLIVTQAGIPSEGQPINPLGLQWYLFILYSFFIAVVAYYTYTEQIKNHKGVLLGLSTILFGILPIDIDAAIKSTHESGAMGSGSIVRAFGLIFIIFPVIFLFFCFGSEEDPIFNLTGGFGGINLPQINNPFSTDAKASPSAVVHRGAPIVVPQQKDVEMADRSPSPQEPRFQTSRTPSPEEARFQMASRTPSPVPQTSPRFSVIPNTRNSVVRNEDAVVEFKAEAMYTYNANVSDPNEISMKKGEILEVIDSKGKWWQVIKVESDGTFTTGIAPSNYLRRI